VNLFVTLQMEAALFSEMFEETLCKIVFGHIWAKRTSFNAVCGNAMAMYCSNAACFLVNCKMKLSYRRIPKLFYRKPLLSLAIHCWHSGICCCVCVFWIMTLCYFYCKSLEPFSSVIKISAVWNTTYAGGNCSFSCL